MQNKSSTQPSETTLMGDEETNEQEEHIISVDAGKVEEDDPKEAELKKEALKAAQDAVSKQKKLTSAFDNECMKLRQTSEPEAPQEVAGASNIDLLHPSTMPVTSTVQTPLLFRGTLKEYQLKGLQWLVNCYEQVDKCNTYLNYTYNFSFLFFIFLLFPTVYLGSFVICRV
ncbi:chromatin-remodeling ATPase INO80-like [Humulus lupulus]|uniref:chromatin-remodeling ATPase INO80-like n=1 Tax=Humulus lupulus TaxID=3486 RepID=UPI002B400DC8|nr:chromatin-remodeling ATPase INO80-like [Humulus lupulus]